MAPVDMATPRPMAKTSASIDSVMPTVATAFAPRRPTKKYVDHGKQGFEHHLKHHGNGEQEDGAVEVAGGVVLVRAAQSFADIGPEAACAGAEAARFAVFRLRGDGSRTDMGTPRCQREAVA